MSEETNKPAKKAAAKKAAKKTVPEKKPDAPSPEPEVKRAKAVEPSAHEAAVAAKVKAGLTREQAEEVVKAQAAHDAGLSKESKASE